MNILTNFNEFLRESLKNKMLPKSDEEIKKAIKNNDSPLKLFDLWCDTVGLPDKYKPSMEDIYKEIDDKISHIKKIDEDDITLKISIPNFQQAYNASTRAEDFDIIIDEYDDFWLVSGNKYDMFFWLCKWNYWNYTDPRPIMLITNNLITDEDDIYENKKELIREFNDIYKISDLLDFLTNMGYDKEVMHQYLLDEYRKNGDQGVIDLFKGITSLELEFVSKGKYGLFSSKSQSSRVSFTL